MMNKLKRIFYNILYSLPFGMKAANDEMLSQKTSMTSDNVGVHQVINENRLSKDLLKGEVTRQVEELRYRDYRVSRESKKYKYLGNGVAVKKICSTVDLNSPYCLVQENKLMIRSVGEELNRVDNEEYANDEYTLSIIYDSLPKFKLEKYCNLFEILRTSEGECTISLKFEKNPSKGKLDTYTFIKELKYISENISKENDYSKINLIQFITYNCIGENDLVKYTLNNLKLQSIIEDKHSYSMVFSFDYIDKEDLTEKFYSKTMDEKYKNNEKKEVTLDLSNQERVRYCSVCGKQMSVYDGDITEETYGYPICKECLEKTLLLE